MNIKPYVLTECLSFNQGWVRVHELPPEYAFSAAGSVHMHIKQNGSFIRLNSRVQFFISKAMHFRRDFYVTFNIVDKFIN